MSFISKVTCKLSSLVLQEPEALENGITSYEKWQEFAQSEDIRLGNEEWKQKDESDIYDYELIRHRLQQLREARENQELENLALLVRNTFERNVGNIGDSRLYFCKHGTKRLIEDYINECHRAIDTLMNATNVDTAALLSTFTQTKKKYGRTALVLSGGSTFGILHIGVIYELFHANLLPRIVSGSSAGSIFASLLCIKTDNEIDGMLDLIEQGFDIFEKRGKEETTLQCLTRLLTHGTWFDNQYLCETIHNLIGDLTFQEAYNRTRRILNVTVSSSSVHEMPRLLNYLTAPNVLIWSAVCASCSVPLVFSAYGILAKNPITGESHQWNPASFIDGSVYSDLPMARLSEMFNVNHFIACQVNPHVAPLLAVAEASQSKWLDLWLRGQYLLFDEIAHSFQMMSELGVLTNLFMKLRSVFIQQYSGDITILPEIYMSEVSQLFKNPDRAYFDTARIRGNLATWKKLSIIENHASVELALDRAVNELRTRLIISSTKVSASSTSLTNGHRRRKSEVISNKSKSHKPNFKRKNSWSPSLSRSRMAMFRSTEDIPRLSRPFGPEQQISFQLGMKTPGISPVPSRKPSIDLKRQPQLNFMNPLYMDDEIEF